MGGTSLTTLDQTIGPGRILRRGTALPYRWLEHRAGEPHLVRNNLVGPRWQPPAPPDRRPLLCFAHMTDLQIADVQSPARFEFFQREFGDPRFAALLPVQRPQEALVVHAVEALARTLRQLNGGPVTGTPLTMAVITGDAIDNAQWNELQMFLALMDGGRVRPGSGGPSYEGVQSTDWPDQIFWRPEGESPHGVDLWTGQYGFPSYPGLLDDALTEFDTPGLGFPWLGCYGNHEALVQGVGAQTRHVLEYLVGGRKPVDPPEQLDRDRALEMFIRCPEAFLTGRQLPVTPDDARRGITRAEFVTAHFGAGHPHGHGFTSDNIRDSSAYYAYDDPASGVRLICLDTACPQGGADGVLDAVQEHWLEQRLIEVHSRYRAGDSREARSSHEDRPVVILSHHGPDTFADRHALPDRAQEPRPLVQGGELVALLHRFPNVVVWLNGHRHINQVQPRPDPAGYGGFWEVTTGSVMGWPSQARLVELVDNGDGTLSVVCTMVDHDSPLSPNLAQGRARLASLHRELAANVPWGVPGTPLAGTPGDRNVDLPVPIRSSTTARRSSGARST
ncbi:TIGR03767 family metallophosphoesterase [Streptacidiphilus rugosus]|uniref:TIGR03767 family metallophosphoesterase n=1 Tax=Streptacidiphilus rugosus TaxID=405783 RepID=UPI00055C2EEA|nr:TIGR03767 family metallophosphoesterase [Streptacidiphilus rugosus]